MKKTSVGDIVVTTDRSRLDLDVIHGFLTTSYWARGIPRETVARSMEHSLCFGAFDEGRQIGFARVVSDRATFAYICDVFALESHRGSGVGKSLMAAIHVPPGASRTASMDSLHSRRAWPLPAVWIRRRRTSGAPDGGGRP